MRDTDRTFPNPWAELICRAREDLRLAPTAFGRLVGGVTRTTVYRWEDGRSIPDQYDVIAKVAKGLAIDIAVALKAAGFDPSAAVAEQQKTLTREEEALRIIRESSVSPAVKEQLIAHLEARNEELGRALAREVELMIQLARGSGRRA